MVANAARMEYLAFSHSSWSCSRAIISNGASLGRLWLSVTVNKDENSSSRVSKLEVVFFSRVWTFLYAALNFREPNEQLCVGDNHQKASTGMRTDLGHYQHSPLKRLSSQTEVSWPASEGHMGNPHEIT